MSAVFRAEGVAHRFGERRVLASAALHAASGRITALFGRNGSGKTTLLRIGAGILRGDQGVVHFRGRVHERPSLHVLARAGLFFLPERDLLMRDVSVGRHLEMCAARCGARGRMRDVIEQMLLGSFLSSRPHELSGGERRRSELALVLLRAPVCLMADEPFMGIAPRDAELIAHLLRNIVDAGCAVIVTGHETRTILDLADDVVWVAGGTTHALGSAADARADWQFGREYLGAGLPGTRSTSH